jgi:hypothetical protein
MSCSIPARKKTKSQNERHENAGKNTEFILSKYKPLSASEIRGFRVPPKSFPARAFHPRMLEIIGVYGLNRNYPGI